MADDVPAARIADMHLCPEHGGGPVLFGSPNVLINGLPAARLGDPLECGEVPDLIAAGSPRVLINGRPAARLGDRTGHGGMIIAGSPNVFIGDADFGPVLPGRPCARQAAAAGAPFYAP